MIAHIDKSTHKEQSIPDHLKETGELAWIIGIPLRIPHLAKLTAYFHDLGKWRIRFESYLRAAVETWRRREVSQSRAMPSRWSIIIRVRSIS